MNNKKILEIKFTHEGKEISIKGYLKLLLTKLWLDGEGFSGKRPFGNSCWEYDIYTPLVKSGVVEGNVDEDGFLEDFNQGQADKVVFELIESL